MTWLGLKPGSICCLLYIAGAAPAERHRYFNEFNNTKKTSLHVLEVWGLIPDLDKPDTVSPTTRHRCDVSSELCCPGSKPGR